MEAKSRLLTDKILDRGASQNGAISRRQLIAAGLNDGGIWERNQTGLLFRVYQSAYSTSGRHVDKKAIWMAGVLAAGEGSVLSHMSAAEAWGFAGSGATEVTRCSSIGRRAPAGSEAYGRARGQAVEVNGARIRALKIHETRRLDESEITARFGIPITTVARTFVDISGSVGPRKLRALLHEAGRMRLLRLDELKREISRSRGKKGIATLRRIVEDWDPRIVLTRNDLETRMLWLCRRHGVPDPQVNRRLAGYEVDFLWPDFKLVVETDGGRDHATTYGMERDRNKDSDLRLSGFVVLRLTWGMLKREPGKSMEKIKAHLKLCGWTR